MNADEVATIVDDARENWAETPWLIDWLIHALKETPMQPGEDKDSFISSRGLTATDDRVSSLFRGMQDGDGADEAPFAAEDEEWPAELPSPAASSPRSPLVTSPSVELDLTSTADDRFGSPIPELATGSTSARQLAPDTSSSAASLPSPPASNAPAPALPTPPLTSLAELSSAPSRQPAPATSSSKPSSAGVNGMQPAVPFNGRPLVASTSSRPSPPASRPTSPKASMSKAATSSVPSRLQTDASKPASSLPAASPPISSSSSSSSMPALSPAEYTSIIQPLLDNTRAFAATPKNLILHLYPRRLATPVSQRKAILSSLHASLKRDSKFWVTWSEYHEGFGILDEWLEAALARPGSPEAINGEGTTELIMSTLNALPWDVPSIKKFGRLVRNIKRVKENAKGRYSTASVRHAAELLGAMDCLSAAAEVEGDKKRKSSLPTTQDPPKKFKPSSPVAVLGPPALTLPTSVSKPPIKFPNFKKKAPATTSAPEPEPAASKPDATAPAKPKVSAQSTMPSTAASSSSSKPPSTVRAASSVPTTKAGPSRKPSMLKESAPTKPAALSISSGASQAFTKRPERPELQLKFGKKPPQPAAAAAGPSKLTSASSGPPRPSVPARSNSGPNFFELALSQRVGGGTTPPPASTTGAPHADGSLKRKHSGDESKPKPKMRVSFAPEETLERTHVFTWLSPEPEDRENVHPRPSGHRLNLHSLDTGEGGAYKTSHDLDEGAALNKTFGCDLDESDWFAPPPLLLEPGLEYDGKLVAQDRERESRIPPASYFTAADVPPNPSEADVVTVAESAETARLYFNRKETPIVEPEPAPNAAFVPGVYNPNIANALDEEQLRQLVANTSVNVPPPALAPPQHQSMPPPPPAHGFYQRPPPPAQQPYQAPAHHGGYSPHVPSYQHQPHQSPPHAPYGGSPAHQPFGASYGQHMGRPQGAVYIPPAPPQATPWAAQQQHQHSDLVEPDTGSYGYPLVHSGFQPPPPTFLERPAYSEPYRGNNHRGGRGGGGGRGRGRGRGHSGWHNY